MTNYNERLDKLLANLVNQVAANEQRLLNGNATREETIDSDSNATMRAEQAIDTELYELCKQVYEATGWKDTEQYLWLDDSHHNTHPEWDTIERSSHDMGGKGTPLYTSDYLLEKLPGLLDIDNKTFSLAVQAQVAPPNFVALYTHTSVVAGKLAGHSTRYINVADTPLKALLKLTIALSEAGE